MIEDVRMRGGREEVGAKSIFSYLSSNSSSSLILILYLLFMTGIILETTQF
jgi:hypothetical protein